MANTIAAERVFWTLKGSKRIPNNHLKPIEWTRVKEDEMELEMAIANTSIFAPKACLPLQKLMQLARPFLDLQVALN